MSYQNNSSSLNLKMKFDNSLRHDKGVAGLTILLSLVTMLFVIGLLVFIFAIMGAEFQDSSSVKASDSATVTDTTLTVTDGGTTLTTCNSANQGSATSVSSAYNETGDVLISSGNYTFSGCTITAVGTEFNNTVWNVTYSYTFAGASWDVINDITGSITDVTDWYDIFIVISAMVVLILLTVIIITAIRGSGLMGGGQGSGNVGSA
jgi:hypothetical protein